MRRFFNMINYDLVLLTTLSTIIIVLLYSFFYTDIDFKTPQIKTDISETVYEIIKYYKNFECIENDYWIQLCINKTSGLDKEKIIKLCTNIISDFNQVLDIK